MSEKALCVCDRCGCLWHTRRMRDGCLAWWPGGGVDDPGFGCPGRLSLAPEHVRAAYEMGGLRAAGEALRGRP